MINSDGIVIANPEIISKALYYYGRGKADFGDYLMFCETKIHGIAHIETFDKNFKKELLNLF